MEDSNNCDPDTRALSNSEIEFWNENGYLVLEGLFSDREIGSVVDEIDDRWGNRKDPDNPLVIDYWEGPMKGRRLRFKDAPDGSRKYSHKLNDLHLESAPIRGCCLQNSLRALMGQLVDGDPMVINSLVFERGSQQPDHFDTYYMPPPANGEMIVSSVCLEDVSPSAGPVRVFPGSHKIPPYRFSHGGIHVVDNDEMPAARDYIASELESRGIEPVLFIGKRGDVLLWHGQLYHGGTSIDEEGSTRRSLVTHYWRVDDVAADQVELSELGGGYLKKDHQTPWE